MVRGIANSKIGFGDLILLLRYFFKLKVSTHPNKIINTYENRRYLLYKQEQRWTDNPFWQAHQTVAKQLDYAVMNEDFMRIF
jgi:hypothetical protein